MIKNGSAPDKENSVTPTFTKRGRFEIIYDILQVARKNAQKTHILYGANLSFYMLEKYLNLLVAQELMEENKGVFSVTEKGKEFMEEFQRLSNYFGDS